MRTVETTATVMAGGTLTAQVPPDIPPLDFPVISVGFWPTNLSLRREDM